MSMGNIILWDYCHMHMCGPSLPEALLGGTPPEKKMKQKREIEQEGLLLFNNNLFIREYLSRHLKEVRE
jgi:hypothetical protein